MYCLKSVPWFNQGTLFYFIRPKISIFFSAMERMWNAVEGRNEHLKW